MVSGLGLPFFLPCICTFLPSVPYTHVFPCRCLAYSYQERLVPVYLAALRVFRVLRPMRAIRISAFYVCAIIITRIRVCKYDEGGNTGSYINCTPCTCKQRQRLVVGQPLNDYDSCEMLCFLEKSAASIPRL